MLKKSKGLLIILISCASGLLIAWSLFQTFQKKRNPEKWIRKRLAKAGIDDYYIDFWVAVSKVESGNYTGTLMKYYNPFSMTVPSKRPSLRDGEWFGTADKQKFSTYANFSDAADDLYLWLVYVKFPLGLVNNDAMVSAMKSKGYFASDATAYLRAVNGYMFSW
jgi:hypothetical protein